mgnify:CR=1 FL=1
MDTDTGMNTDTGTDIQDYPWTTHVSCRIILRPMRGPVSMLGADRAYIWMNHRVNWDIGPRPMRVIASMRAGRGRGYMRTIHARFHASRLPTIETVGSVIAGTT